MNKEEINCVYSANGITTMSTKQYNNYIEIINNLKKENQQLKKQKDDVVELIKKQLLSNTNITKYTDEMCLRDVLRMLGETNDN